MIVSAIDREGKFFTMVDRIGFADGDLDEGFNRESTNYVDALGDPYPKLNEVAIILYAYLNKSKDEAVQEVIVNGDNLRDSSDAADYDTVASSFNVTIAADGWYTVYAFILPLSSTQAVYWDVEKQVAVNPLTAEEHIVADLVNVSSVNSEVYQNFFTPNTERMLNDKIGDLADLGMKDGKCSKEYRELLYANSYVDTQIGGAHVKFNDGYMYTAAELIEDLNSTNPYEFC